MRFTWERIERHLRERIETRKKERERVSSRVPSKREKGGGVRTHHLAFLSNVVSS